jgi:23S rRNA (guanosine2251-2'-O)-methyltransferase
LAPTTAASPTAPRSAVAGLTRRSPPRLGLNATELGSEFFKGTSAERAYRSFVFPKGPVALAVADNPARVRIVAQQVAFLAREHRAHTAAYLRNTDLREAERQAAALRTFPLTIVLDNIRSAENVGVMFRIAETAGVREVITCGFTPHPPEAKLLKTALGAAEYVRTRHFPSTAQAIDALEREGIPVWACETTAGAEPYAAVAFPDRLALVLGNEVIGVDTTVLERCTRTLRIPTFGLKNSLNVGTAMAVLVYEALRQWGAFPSRTP